MKTVTKVLASITAFVGIIAPAVAPAISHFIAAHPNASAIIAAISTILALFHNPVASA